MNLDHQYLVSAFLKAKEAASLLSHVSDGGSANLHAVKIYAGKWNGRIKKAATEAGICSSRHSRRGRSCVAVSFGMGQGNRNTAMNEAACAVLKEAGLDAMMFYMMD